MVTEYVYTSAHDDDLSPAPIRDCSRSTPRISFCPAGVFSRSPPSPRRRRTQRIDELTVQRLNVVDANGTLRFVLANKDRMHPGVMDGVTIDRPRPVAGMLFFNDEGDEVGGLTYTGTRRQRPPRERRHDVRSAEAGSDRRHQLQREQRPAHPPGCRCGIDPSTPLSELITQLNAANALAEPARSETPRSRRSAPRRRRDRAASSSARAATGRRRCRWPMRTASRAWCLSVDAGRRREHRVPRRQRQDHSADPSIKVARHGIAGRRPHRGREPHRSRSRRSIAFYRDVLGFRVGKDNASRSRAFRRWRRRR